jgi:hypothetical protein
VASNNECCPGAADSFYRGAHDGHGQRQRKRKILISDKKAEAESLLPRVRLIFRASGFRMTRQPCNRFRAHQARPREPSGRINCPIWPATGGLEAAIGHLPERISAGLGNPDGNRDVQKLESEFRALVSNAEFRTNYMKELHVFVGRVLTVLPREARETGRQGLEGSRTPRRP